MPEKKKIYFISDAHLGLYPTEKSAERERLLVSWLDGIRQDAAQLYMLGDIFDFWHEYRHVVPRGHTRLLGKLAELSDDGITLHYFTGNHDIWIRDYLPGEIGMKLYRHHIVREIDGCRFFIGHGDGLGSGETSYRLMKAAFTNKALQWIFARLHPNAAIAFGKWWSRKSRYAKGIVAEPYRGDDKEKQVLFARQILTKEPVSYFIFGHRHLPFDVRIDASSRVINVGDWISHFTYAVWDGGGLELHSAVPEKEHAIFRK